MSVTLCESGSVASEGESGSMPNKIGEGVLRRTRRKLKLLCAIINSYLSE